MHKKSTVRLSAEARGVCQEIVKRLKGTSDKVKRAPMLLQADADGPEWSDMKIAEAYDCRGQTVETVRKRLVTEGLAVALERNKRSTAPTPPHAGWRSRRPGDRDAVRHTACGRRAMVIATARRRIGGVGGGGVDLSRDGPQDAKKNGLTTRKIAYWVIPPDQDAACVACMDDVLDTSEKADEPHQPVRCMDEQPVQGLTETPVPIAATPQHGKRVAYAYERNGTARILLCAEPLSGFRQATTRARRTKVAWAIEVAQGLETRYVACAKVTLVGDTLNTHPKGAFYEAFPPERARASVKRLAFCYTPTHGRWLNVAACE